MSFHRLSCLVTFQAFQPSGHPVPGARYRGSQVKGHRWHRGKDKPRDGRAGDGWVKADTSTQGMRERQHPQTKIQVPGLLLDTGERRGQKESSVEMSTHLILTLIIAIKTWLHKEIEKLVWLCQCKTNHSHLRQLPYHLCVMAMLYHDSDVL